MDVSQDFVVGGLAGNGYDGHALSNPMEQISILTAVEPNEAYVDKGDKGHQHVGRTTVFIAGQ